jgi:hypothetical protein
VWIKLNEDQRRKNKANTFRPLYFRKEKIFKGKAFSCGR